jgi:branched-chain amino acid aminotransferase
VAPPVAAYGGWAGIVWLNGQLVAASEARISVFDRGILLGDGVYETLRVHRRKPFRWEEHRARLDQSLGAAQIRLPFPTSTLLQAVQACTQANDLAAARVRITVTRGEGDPGFDPMPGKQPTTIIAASPWRSLGEEATRAGVAAILASIRQTGNESLDPSLKSISRIHLVLARMEAARAGAQEAILLGSDGNVREGTASNVFMVSQGRLLTPPVGCGILEGVTRALVLELAAESNLPCAEQMVSPRDLMGADEVFLTNTSWGALPVGRLDGKPVGGPVALELGRKIAESVDRECST